MFYVPSKGDYTQFHRRVNQNTATSSKSGPIVTKKQFLRTGFLVKIKTLRNSGIIDPASESFDPRLGISAISPRSEMKRYINPEMPLVIKSKTAS